MKHCKDDSGTNEQKVCYDLLLLSRSCLAHSLSQSDSDGICEL